MVNEQIDVSFSCFCPGIDHQFCHNIVKVAVDPQGDNVQEFLQLLYHY